MVRDVATREPGQELLPAAGRNPLRALPLGDLIT